MKKILLPVLLLAALGVHAAKYTATVDADNILAKVNRADLLGVNIAVYNQPEQFETAMTGALADINIGLVRMPGGSVSDKYYWNGNGIIENGAVDQSKYKAPYWEVDYSAYKPGFAVNNTQWEKADPGFINIDAKTMHEVTRKHPVARSLVTVNAGTGTPEMAAEWVRWANIENGWDVKYWEIGNELNGDWEAGHIRPDGSTMTAEKYVEIFVAFAKAMKAVDPTIKVGGPSCDVGHHDDYFEPLLRDAGDYVDFLTLHFYSLRSSLAPERELFDGLETLRPITDRLDQLVEKYQPARKGEIEYSITEWNSKLPKDQDAYRLFNGLWFASWIGEMVACGVDSATVWDMFSGKDNGHGMLVKRGDDYVPTGRYWGFWLWSHYMADTLVESTLKKCDDLHIHATRDDDSVYVMIMNESRSAAYPVTIDLKNFKPAKMGTEVTLSSREYFWNPEAFAADWNNQPTQKEREVQNGMSITVPPYCVKVIQFKRAGAPNTASEATTEAPQNTADAELKVLLPESGFGDMDVEGWVRVFQKGSDQPFGNDLGKVKLSADAGAQIEQIEPELYGATAKFNLKPAGPGIVTVTAECAGLKTQQSIEFKPVDFEETIVWDFDNGTIQEPHATPLEFAIETVPGRNGKVLRVDIPNIVVRQPNNHIFDITGYPRGTPQERIGGVIFDLLIPKELKTKDGGANLQIILQSHGAYWIPCGQISLSEKRGEWQTVRMEIPDKKFLKVMDQGFAVLFLGHADKPVEGSLYIDNLGFLLRPEQ